MSAQAIDLSSHGMEEPHIRLHRTQSMSREPSSQNKKTNPTGSVTVSSPSARNSSSHERDAPATRLMHQRFVFTDPVAFRYLEEDPSTTVLARRERLDGYELYLVEQWACSRVHPTFVITAFTGDPSHSVLASVLSVPTDEETWSPRLRVYFTAVSQFHARPKETQLGMLMVTNLSSFPSALTVIPVPRGDVKEHREDFIVNENLKRLGCSGRAGLSVASPTGATQAKFYQLYRTSDRIPLYSAVIELVQLCQVALMMFGKLGAEYADGLLCDVTERAINDWWTQLGTDFYNVEPSDGILGPTTVAALLGMLIGARNRLNAYGAPVAKDAFDIACLKRGVAYFQKSQKLTRTRRLDRPTHGRLCKVTSKAASGEGWTVPKAVKSTVAELGGKGGEMVMGMVGAREKPGIVEIETMDIDRFVQLISGERAKWLWHGKPRKSLTNDATVAGEASLVFGKDDNGGYVWAGKRRDSFRMEGGVDKARRRSEETEKPGLLSPESTWGSEVSGERDQHSRKTVLKSVTGKMTDARSGFGRIKDAVGIPGLRGHHHKHSKDEGPGLDLASNLLALSNKDQSETALLSAPAGPPTGPPAAILEEGQKSAGAEAATNPFQAPMDEPKTEKSAEPQSRAVSRTKLPPHLRSTSSSSLPIPKSGPASPMLGPSNGGEVGDDSAEASDAVAPISPMMKPLLKDLYADTNRAADGTSPLLRRTQSASHFIATQSETRHDAWWPRRVSFSAVEEAVLLSDGLEGSSTEAGNHVPRLSDSLRLERSKAIQAQRMREKMAIMEEQECRWVQREFEGVESLDMQANRDLEELHAIYHQRFDDYQTLRGESNALLTEERSHLTERMREVEMLGAKLEYELNTLVSKVEDVEDGVNDLERQVLDVEEKARQLEAGERVPESWMAWGLRVVVGVKQKGDGRRSAQ
ncbi:MAG: hypothetical protein M1832_003811 [Thelocarpon impressellum]|nr:MAG: hypothetical protein M1832_003811 [Thelocarpon impressellum]